MDLAARTEYLKDLRNLTSRCQSKLECLVASIGWSLESLNKNIGDSASSNETATSSITPKPEMQEGNPQLEDFEKRYNDLLSALPTHHKKSQKKSEAEALADLLEFERNAKRRRISYKNKVHTKNKSHTEVLRELVREQMEVLKEISGEEAQVETVSDKTADNEEDNVGLIQLRFSKGNPHTVWQKIGQEVENASLPLDSCVSHDVRSRRSSCEGPSKAFESDRNSWRAHDDRYRQYAKDKRRDSYDRKEHHRTRHDEDKRLRVSGDDYVRHRHKSNRRRTSSPDK